MEGMPWTLGSISQASLKVRKSFEDGLADVVAVAAVVQKDMEVHAAVDGDGVPKIGDEFAVERADLLGGHHRVPDPVRPAGKVDRAGDERFVHRQDAMTVSA